MISKYTLPDNSIIIGNELPDLYQQEFSKAMIKFNAESLYAYLFENHLLKNKCKPTQSEIDNFRILSILVSANQFNNVVSNTVMPECFRKILTEDLSKKEQTKMLRGVTLTLNELMRLFYFGEEIGYTFTHIKSELAPKSVSAEKLPKLAFIDSSKSVVIIGGEVSEGQARKLIDERKVLIARILSKGNIWHCLLQTFSGLKGKESGVQGAQPHLHYLSDKTTGLTYSEIVEQLKSGKYPNAPIHIPLNN